MVIYIWKMNLTLQFINNKSINHSERNNKKKIMAATNWTIISKHKKSGVLCTCELGAKWTYKTALGIAIESNNNETHEVVCVVETNKILLKNEKEEEKKTNI